MNIEQRIDQLEQMAKDIKDEIAVMKAKTSDKKWPEMGDTYHCIGSDGRLASYGYADDNIDRGMKNIGNCFKSEKEAQAQRDAMKVIAELRSCNGVYPFIVDGKNYCVVVHLKNSTTHAAHQYVADCGWQSIYFISQYHAEAAILMVGSERIIKAARWLAMREV